MSENVNLVEVKKDKNDEYINNIIDSKNGSEKLFLQKIKIEKMQYVEKAIKEDFYNKVSPRVINNILNDKTTFKNAYHNWIKKIRKEQKKKAKEYKPLTTTKDVKLINKNIKDKLEEIPDNSVDYIITDPPYPYEYLDLYEDLSYLASRVLKDGGLLIVMTGQSYLPEIINQLSKHMTYHWTCSYLTPGGQAVQLWRRNVNTFWKPLLIFRKGTYNGDWFGDVCKSNVNSNDKRFHEWGQSLSGMIDIIERFTYPDDTILDPFCGGGTTGVGCALLGRKFIGIDVNANCITTSKERIKEVVDNASKARED